MNQLKEDQLTLLTELKSKDLNLNQLYLNPNNPRIMGKKRTERIEDSRIIENAIQTSVNLEIIKEGVSDIVEKVLKLGFLKVDRIVVRKIKNVDDKYVVLEGNRRVTSLKKLLDEHTKGIRSLSYDLIDSITNLEVLEYEGKDEQIEWILQGIRHINGIKEWGPLQQSRFLAEMYLNKNMSPTDLDEMTGLGRNIISRKIKSYFAWEYARKVYHGEVEEDHYSIFQEVIFARPIIHKWLLWNESEREFENEESFLLLLNWYIGDEEGNRKLYRALDARDLLTKALLKENSNILDKFINNDEYSYQEAKFDLDKKKAEKEAQQDILDLDQRLEFVQNAVGQIKTLPITDIVEQKNKKDDFISSLEELKKAVSFNLLTLKNTAEFEEQ
ncbi:hypothetical protein [Winogradskyella flava]|uniref:ParB/Sulfiredoxin domain-containing protein n=1 Tax=Winogradskyella flava TaxID=1884876 RepID=A0A842ITX4_9FLAO|nr:hypothetical protein [Winogradskyella flava]MBC2845609.1 hypothetical protein [Winogradskyella flava]